MGHVILVLKEKISACAYESLEERLSFGWAEGGRKDDVREVSLLKHFLERRYFGGPSIASHMAEKKC